MGTNSISYNDRIRYTLQHKTHGSLIITEPVGWENDEKEYQRHKKYHGILVHFSNSLKFIGDGAIYITFAKDVYGVNDNIRLIRDERNPQTDIWERSYSGNLDITTYEINKGEVSIKFNASGLERLLKSRESEKVEIERDTSINGENLETFYPHSVELRGRKIFLRTIYNIQESNNSAYMHNFTDDANKRGKTVGVPLFLTAKSHENAHSVIPQTSFDNDGDLLNANGDVGVMFFAVSDKARTLKIKIDISFKIEILEQDDLDWKKFWLRLATYENGIDLNYKESINLFYKQDQELSDLNNETVTVTYEGVINLLAGESLSLQFSQLMKGDNIYHEANLTIDCKNIVCNFKIEEDSFFETTSAPTVLAHNLGQRLTQIITGRSDAFYSEIMGRLGIGYEANGEAAWFGFSHGMWVRGFTKSEEEDNKYKPFTTSFKDYLAALSAVWNLGMGIERIGFKERIRVEKLEYFYNNNVTIKLPNQVQNVKRSVAKEFYYSGIESGFLKGGEYKEAMGLDEYNAKSTYTTVISALSKSYKSLSIYRGDSYGKEFARRKQKAIFPDEDTTYDKDIFIMDLKQGVNTMLERFWQDDFEQEPTGVYDPATATNLRFSPFNIMLRHAWKFGSGFLLYASDYVRYGSSTANSNLTTKLNGQNEYSENGNIINSELKRPRFVPEWIEFEHQVDFDLIKQVEGTSIILGKEIPNFYGLVQFINEKGENEKGYLFQLKPNKKGKWRLLKANR